MKAERKLKAYAWHDDHDGTDTIEWFESAGQAKQYFANENGLSFTECRVYRVPWADNYKNMEEIPKELYFENGWWCPCKDCGGMVIEGEGVIIDNTVYCHKCWELRTEGEE